MSDEKRIYVNPTTFGKTDDITLYSNEKMYVKKNTQFLVREDMYRASRDIEISIDLLDPGKDRIKAQVFLQYKATDSIFIISDGFISGYVVIGIAYADLCRYENDETIIFTESKIKLQKHFLNAAGRTNPFLDPYYGEGMIIDPSLGKKYSGPPQQTSADKA